MFFALCILVSSSTTIRHFPIAKFQPIDRMSIEYMTVGLIEGGPDPDFDPRWHRFVIYHEF